MRRHRRPATAFALALVLALGAVGGSYALWFQVLTFNGTVNTAELKTEWFTEACNENEAPTAFNNPFFPVLPKQVGSVVQSGASPGSDTISLTLTNAYPGYAVDCKLEYRVLGTIPVHVERERFELDLDGDGTYETSYDCTTDGIGQQPTCRDTTEEDWHVNSGPPLYVEWINGLGCQLHPGDRDNGDLLIGVRQTAKENTTYHVRLTIEFNQYNESGYQDCNMPRPSATPYYAPAGLTSNP